MTTFVVKDNRDFNCKFCGGRIDPRTEFCLTLAEKPQKDFFDAVDTLHLRCYVERRVKRVVNVLNSMEETTDVG